MNIWGKLFGGLFGFMMLGPLGLLIGIFVGNIFDRGFAAQFTYHATHQHEIQEAYFRTTFLVMGHVAKADGVVSETEIRAARSIMQRMGLTEEQRQRAIHYFTQGKQPDFDLENALDELVQTCHRQRILLQMFVEIQFQAALSEQQSDARKQQVLGVICQRLGFAPIFQRYAHMFGSGGSYYQYQQHQHASHKTNFSLQDDYELLEVKADAKPSEIKKAYRLLMSQNHPDKLIAKGLPEEMIKIATDKTQRIQAAYERIKAAHKF